jgi:hypothetical protein
VGNLTVQALIPQLVNRTFNVAILPGTTGIDEQGGAARFFKPPANSFGHILGIVAFELKSCHHLWIAVS